MAETSDNGQDKNDGFFANDKLTKDNPAVFKDNESKLNYFDLMLKQSNTPGLNAPLANSFRGFNPFSTGPAMMEISDNIIGLMFITRPQLNLSDYNIYRSERLISLAGASTNDISGYTRGLLDPRWAASNLGGFGHPMLDNNQPFIACLNEYLKTSTGFSDLQLRFGTSEPGIRQQVYQHVTGKLEENGQYSIQQTYHNPRPLIIQNLFQIWEGYISEVVSGDNQLQPYPDYLVGHRCDHDCRIYHMVLNRDNEFLESIFASIQSIPSTYPAGAIADIDRTQNTRRASGQDELSIQFSSTGMRFDEISLINAFNEHTFLFNPDLYDDINSTTQQRYKKVPISEFDKYRYMMYPLLLPTEQEIIKNGAKIGIRQGIKLTWWTRIK